MAKPEYINISKLKFTPNNPRTITTENFEKLKRSITDNPDYFEARPIIASDRTGELVIIGGNMRLRAAKDLGLKEVPVYIMHDLTEDRERELVIRDNAELGAWDVDILLNEFDVPELQELGLSDYDLHLNFDLSEPSEESDGKPDVDAHDLIEKSIDPKMSISPSTDYDESKLFIDDRTGQFSKQLDELHDEGVISGELERALRIRNNQMAIFRFEQFAKLYLQTDNEKLKSVLEQLIMVMPTAKEAIDKAIMVYNDQTKKLKLRIMGGEFGESNEEVEDFSDGED